MAFKVMFSLVLGLLGVAFFLTPSGNCETWLIGDTTTGVEKLIKDRRDAEEKIEYGHKRPYDNDKTCTSAADFRSEFKAGNLCPEDLKRLIEIATRILGEFCKSKKCYYYNENQLREFRCGVSPFRNPGPIDLGFSFLTCPGPRSGSGSESDAGSNSSPGPGTTGSSSSSIQPLTFIFEVFLVISGFLCPLLR